MTSILLTLSFSLAVCLASTAAAQQVGPALHRAPAQPQYGGVYHPVEGLLAGANQQSRRGPNLIFNNASLSNYFVLAGQLQEFVDEGVLLDRNHDSLDQVNGMDFTYCSSDPSPNGVGATVRFYHETIACQGPSNWPVADCSYSFVGLPGGPNGNLTCWTIGVDLTGFECSLTTDPAGQRRFGWGTSWSQPASGPWLASGGFGTLDQFEWFDLLIPNGNAAHLGCFSFGPNAPASFANRLYGNPSETTSISAIAPGRDDSLILRVNHPVQAGNTVQFDVLDGPFGARAASLMWISRNRVETHLGVQFGIDAHELAEYSSRIRMATSFKVTGQHSLHIPVGVAPGVYYTQASAVWAGRPYSMSNGLQHYVF